jgi:hypothetical protein
MLAALAQTVNNFLIDYKKSTEKKSDEVKSKKSVRSKS